MSNFWQFRNLNEEEGELVLYGNIASRKSWWEESTDGIYPKQFSDDLKALGGIKNLTVRINSNGGDVFAATAIYTQLKSHTANVTAVIDGVSASAATIIMAAADTVKAPSNALLMIHNPLSMLYGYYTAEQLAKVSNVLETVKDSILNAYVNKTGRDRKELSAMMDKETWMTADEARNEGFVDEVMFEQTVDASMTNDNRFLVVNSVLHDMSKFDTRPVLNRGVKPPQPEIPTIALMVNKHKESEPVLDIKNVEDLKKHFPELCNQLVSNAAAVAAEAERTRIQAIDDIAMTVSQDLVNNAKYVTPISAEALAFQALKDNAAKGQQIANNRAAELNAGSDVAASGGVDGAQNSGSISDEIVNMVADSANKNRSEGK